MEPVALVDSVTAPPLLDGYVAEGGKWKSEVGVKGVTGVAIIVDGNNLVVVIPPLVTNDVEDGDDGGDVDVDVDADAGDASDASDGPGIKGVVVIHRTPANMLK